MTVEERPQMQNSEEYWQAEYAKQRKDRLTDAVHDYLDDAGTSILAFYNDLQDIIVEMHSYHKTFAQKAEGALVLINGKQKQENVETSQFLTENGTNMYSYQADVTLEKIKQFQRGVGL